MAIEIYLEFVIWDLGIFIRVNSKKQYYKLALVSTSLLLIAVAAFFVLKLQIEKKVITIQQKELAIAQNQSSIETLAVLQKDFEKAKAYSVKLEDMLITSDEILDFRKAIIDLGRQNNIEVAVNFGADAKSEGLLLTPFTATIVGKSGIEGFKTFMESVETSNYFVKINSMDISQSGLDINGNISGSVASF